MTERHVFLGMPGYGRLTAGAARGFWRACQRTENVWHQYQEGSLLACNFNALWCGALNLVHQGKPVDYFAMLHDDIAPEDGWLDKLIDELEAKQLDVLGVAVPLKDTRGLTSLALHKEDDNWMPQCRLSMHDLFELPETFTSKDVGAPLLLNTGCWVCKFGDWAKQVHFEINDRIVFNRAANRYQAQTEPEDWFFSRLLHEMGLKVGATRKIRLCHQGDMGFSNEHPWGTEPFDREHTDKSPVPGAFPHDVPGWLLVNEGKELTRLAKGKRVLEIGSYCGLSTVCLARSAREVVACDYFDGRGTDRLTDTFPMFQECLKRHGVAGKVEVCSPDAEFPEPEYDLVFIDGAHDYESVRRDIIRASRVLAPTGLLVFHDYREYPQQDGRWDEGVNRAVRELISEGGRLMSTTGSLAVVSPAAVSLLEV